MDDEVFWRRDGGYFPVEYQATPIRRQGQLAGAVITFHDITERHRTEREIQYLAFHDPLTGLPSRVLFAEELSQTLARLRSRGERFALHLMDVDHFKDINDSLGHPIGDQLLCSIANRVTELIRGADIFARLGGDEFGVIQTAIHSPADASLLAARIIESMGADFNVEGIRVRSNTSIGIVVVDDAAGIDSADLLSRADVALYKAKEAGRGVYAFFEDAMTIQLRREMELSRHLSGAVERDELYLEYQPQIDVVTGRLRGVEALLRWHHPVQGLTPGEGARTGHHGRGHRNGGANDVSADPWLRPSPGLSDRPTHERSTDRDDALSSLSQNGATALPGAPPGRPAVRRSAPKSIIAHAPLRGLGAKPARMRQPHHRTSRPDVN